MTRCPFCSLIDHHVFRFVCISSVVLLSKVAFKRHAEELSNVPRCEKVGRCLTCIIR